MTKIEASSYAQAYKDAAKVLKCSVSELKIEVVQSPREGILGLFKRNAIIIAVVKKTKEKTKEKPVKKKVKNPLDSKIVLKQKKPTVKKPTVKKQRVKVEQNILNDTIMPQSFVSTQDDECYDISDINFTADYDDEDDTPQEDFKTLKEIAQEVSKDINSLFKLTCFKLDKIDVSIYNETTLLLEFKGQDSALLIGKEGYRYKSLSYMIFNWVNSKYKLKIRIEIAEFLKNQEESIERYLDVVHGIVARNGRCQTKVFDGTLIQIALRSLREKYPDKYVAIRSTKDGLKYIIINDYHSK
jgi:spoIIIJ-associated protein